MPLPPLIYPYHLRYPKIRGVQEKELGNPVVFINY